MLSIAKRIAMDTIYSEQWLYSTGPSADLVRRSSIPVNSDPTVANVSTRDITLRCHACLGQARGFSLEDSDCSGTAVCTDYEQAVCCVAVAC